MAQWRCKIGFKWLVPLVIEAPDARTARKLALDEKNWFVPQCSQDGLAITNVHVRDRKFACRKIRGKDPAAYDVELPLSGDFEVEVSARDSRTAERSAISFIYKNFEMRIAQSDYYMAITDTWLPIKLTTDTVEDVLADIDDDNEEAVANYKSRVALLESELVSKQARFILDGVKKLKDATFPVDTPVGKATDFDDLIRKFIAIVAQKEGRTTNRKYIGALLDAIRKRIDSGYIPWLLVNGKGDVAPVA